MRLILPPGLVTPLRHSIPASLYQASHISIQNVLRAGAVGLVNALPFQLRPLPSYLADLWESILHAVPKKKTSHRKKRQRFLAGKALKDSDSRIAHITDIFCIAVAPRQIISASGSSSIKIYSTTEPDFPLVQTLDAAHKLGCHHLAASQDGSHFASAGFGGDVKIWHSQEGSWTEQGEIVDGNKAGEVWAIALSADGQYLAATSIDGRINVWDIVGGNTKIREFETKGSFGMAIDLVSLVVGLDILN
ncbi:MAG: hypothetical protein Q9196_003301 [Gyalolechia fulgens]